MTETSPDQPVAAPSRNRQIGATIAGGLVTVVLGVAANVAIGKATNWTQNKINKPQTVDNQ
jgi:hypothetical protein